MATKKTAYEAPTPASDKKKALQTALAQIDKSFGKGTVMRLGDRPEMNVEAIPTGSTNTKRGCASGFSTDTKSGARMCMVSAKVGSTSGCSRVP